MIKKTDKGWLVDCRPSGVSGKRYRKVFKSKIEAVRWQSWLISNKQNDKDWEPKRDDRRSLGDLIDYWYDSHGCGLKDGLGRKNILKAIDKRLCFPSAFDVSGSLFVEYRKQRLESGIKPNTVNHEHAYLRAMFNELIRIGVWEVNPLGNIRQLRIDEPELSYLTQEQIGLLLSELSKSNNPHVLNISLLCFATGCRWSEAETLRAENVHSGKITFVGTKSGKNRTVPVENSFSDILRFKDVGRLFGSAYSAFRKAFDRTGIELPPGQLAHVLRHTFASHFMQSGGSILVLQRVLGHSSLNVTMRYAHFSPDHLEEVRKLNPLYEMDIKWTK